MRIAVWLVDRACIDAPFWDAHKAKLASTMITRMKSSLHIDSTEGLPILPHAANDGVLKDLRITLASSSEPWRLITYRTRRGHVLVFLTNGFDLLPGVIAFVYARRCDEEKCFDTWKNDFSQAKVWGKGSVAIKHQVRLAIVTSVWVALALHATLGRDGFNDHKALRKQDKRQAAPTDRPDGTDRPDWTVPVLRYTAKVSRQVLRFKHGFLKPASPALYKRELRPMLLAYL